MHFVEGRRVVALHIVIEIGFAAKHQLARGQRTARAKAPALAKKPMAIQLQVEMLPGASSARDPKKVAVIDIAVSRIPVRDRSASKTDSCCVSDRTDSSYANFLRASPTASLAIAKG